MSRKHQPARDVTPVGKAEIKKAAEAVKQNAKEARQDEMEHRGADDSPGKREG